MNAAKKAARKRIKGLVSKWHELLGLDVLGISVEHTFLDNENGDTIADTTAQWEYRKAHIRWYLPCAISLDDAELETTVVHELVHVLLAPMEHNEDNEEKLNEFAVETMTLALLKAVQ